MVIFFLNTQCAVFLCFFLFLFLLSQLCHLVDGSSQPVLSIDSPGLRTRKIVIYTKDVEHAVFCPV